VGDQGPAATVAVGTVTTGAPGTNAQVVNSGTTGAAVLDFTIPRGYDGEGSGDMMTVVYDPAGKAAQMATEAELAAHTERKDNPHGVTADQVGAVPTSRKVNGKALSADIALSAGDIGARPDTWTPTAEQVGADPEGMAAEAVDTHNEAEDAHADLFAAKQGTITAAGILKGDGTGGVTAAEAGTDYAAAEHTHTLSDVTDAGVAASKGVNNVIEMGVTNAVPTVNAVYTFVTQMMHRSNKVSEGNTLNSDFMARGIAAGTADLTPGVSKLTVGQIYLVYE